MRRWTTPAGPRRGCSQPARPPAYLREVWRSAHWRLFAVLGSRPLAEPPAVLTQLGTDSFTLVAPRPGRYLVRVRFTPLLGALARARLRARSARAAGPSAKPRARAVCTW